MEGDKRVRTRRIVAGICLFVCTFICFSPNLQGFYSFEGYEQQTALSIPKPTGIWSLLVKSTQNELTIPTTVSPQPQKINVSYKLFGIIPFKNSVVEVMPSMSLIPGGQSIGVTLQAKGVMVVGQAPVVSEDGKKHYPAKEAGISVGDIILKINDKDVRSDQDVANEIHEAGKKGIVKVVIKHHNEIMEKRLTPVYCAETMRYRVGLFVRDEAAGVGTLTFYDPETAKYGALGHVINDADTNQPIDVLEGKVMASTIYAIEKGIKGHPGEKLGSFVANSLFKGSIEKNTVSGIFGTLNGELGNRQPIPVGWSSEIKEGPAKIYTVIQGEKVEEFDVSIERIMQNRSDSKNMIIEITDERLINETGGIVQGMSGSPIIQDGKIIGAVTHVFVNDSKRGYGVFIENMLKDAGLLKQNQAA